MYVPTYINKSRYKIFISGEVMLLAHIADAHLGLIQYGYPWREDDVYRAFLEAFDKAIKEGVNVIIISGDMFDRYRPPNRALKIAMSAVKKAIDKGIKVYAVLGEHDIPRRSDEPPQNLIPGLKLLGTSKTPLYDEVVIDGRNYIIAGVSHHPPKYLGRLKKILNDLRGILRRFRGRSILMLHQSIKQFFVFEEGLDLADLPSEASYVAMGHLHMRKKERLENGTLVAYPGSLEIIKSDEIDEWLENGKGFYIVDLSSDEPSLTPANVNVRPQLRIVAKYPNHILAVRAALGRLRSLGIGRTWDKGILHVDIEIDANRKDIGRNIINEILSIVTPGIYVRPRLRITSDRDIKDKIYVPEEVNELDIVKLYISNELKLHAKNLGEELAKIMIKIKNALASNEFSLVESYVNELIKYESIWKGRIEELKPIHTPLTTTLTSKETTLSSLKDRHEGKGLLRFIRGKS